MGLIRLIIAGDEKEVRNNIKKNIDWTGLGYELVGDAENGREAFELVKTLVPDVILTDIRMPRMDGLELAGKVFEAYPAVKVIILSGYKELEYAQRAIRYNVMEYIVKPVNLEKVTELLVKLRENRKAELKESTKVETVETKKTEPAVEFTFGYKIEAELERIIKFGSMKELQIILGNLTGQAEKRKGNAEQYQMLILYLTNVTIQISRRLRVNLFELHGKRDVFELFSGMKNLRDFEEWFRKSCIYMHEVIKEQKNNSTKDLILESMKYIAEHYRDPYISCDAICRRLHISPAYFSTIFKKETGKSYVAYLTELRLNEAIELLNKTEDKACVIAAKVGYLEPNYFSYVFKKKFGVAPSNYRRR